MKIVDALQLLMLSSKDLYSRKDTNLAWRGFMLQQSKNSFIHFEMP